MKERLERWREGLRERRTTNAAYRALVGVTGGVVLVAGIIAIPYPGPGWAIVFIGLAILASEFVWAHHTLKFAKGRSHLAFVSTSRDHRHEVLRIADAATGAIRDVLEETAKTQFESGNGRVNWHESSPRRTK